MGRGSAGGARGVGCCFIGCDPSARSFARKSFRPHFLVREQRLVDLVGDSHAARLDEILGVFLGQERAPGGDAGAVPERALGSDAGEHVLEHGIDEGDFEILCLLMQLGVRRRFGARRGEPASYDGVEVRGGDGREGAGHHITSMSAWMAPAALIACRIEMRSRGPMPSALRPSTSCCSDTRTSRPITMMPERLSMMILAERSGSICSCSISVSKATTLPWNCFGTVSCTLEGSIGSAVAVPI